MPSTTLGIDTAGHGASDRAGGASLIQVEGLGKRFGQRTALSGVTFTVPRGEAFALVGPNGSGKTTLLRILATLLSADHGDATIAGISVNDDPDGVRALIGYVPDHSGAYRRLTAQEFVEFYAGVHRLPRPSRSRVAADLVELVGLANHRHDDVERLSPGQQQRLGLARALVHDPTVLVLDGLSDLDPQAQVELAELLAELRSMGKTVVVSSHHLAELEQMCTWVGLLNDGKMVAAGPLAEVREQAKGSRSVLVEVAGDEADLAAAAALMEGFPGVVGVKVREGGVEATVDESFAGHELVSHLVQRGAKVSSLHGSGQALDHIFRRLTEGAAP